MKKVLRICILLFVGLSLNLTVQAQTKVEWPERTAFHSVMSTTFHPAEDGNLEPIKKRSGEMVQKAKEWKESTPPKEFDKPVIKKKLKQLYKESKALDKMIQKKASDAKIKAALTKLHDRFHEIAEACNHSQKGH
jgi:hypothetical protein